MDDSADPLPLSSTFPPPPPHHALFTPANLALLASLQQAHSSPSAASKGKQRAPAPTEDEERVVRQLERPRVDWIEQDGGFEVFGDFYPIPTHVPTVTEMGLPQLTPPELPPVEALRSLLLAYLQTFSALVHALGKPPPPLPTSQEEADAFRPGVKEVGRLAEIGVNMIVRVNELRSEQAKATLEGLMQAQIAQRKADTQTLKARCADLSSTLASLRAPLPTSHQPQQPSEDALAALSTARAALEQAVGGLTEETEGPARAADESAERARREQEALDLLDEI